MARVVHFEIHAANPERAAQFYTHAFGWRFEHIPQIDYWMVMTGEGPGIDGGMLRRQGPPPAAGQAVNAHMCTIGVDDLDAALKKAMDAGATSAVPRMAIPGVGYVAYLVDPEGNIFGVYQEDRGATA